MASSQLSAAVSEDRRTVDKARTLLLVAVGGESPDAPVVRRHAAEDHGAAVAAGISRAQAEQISMTMLGRRRKCLRIRSKKRQFRVSYVNARRNQSVVVRWKRLRAENPARSLRLQTKQSWSESEIRI